MSARVRFLMSFVFTLAIVGSGALTWGLRTGQLTIFGDSAPTVNANLAVTGSVDLQKAVDAGDHQLTVTPNGIGLSSGAASGTAVFTLGQREIVAIDRVVPTLTEPIPPQSRLTMAFAGSPDGVSFNKDSPAQLVTTSAASPTGVPIELGFLIPTDSRFLRVTLSISRTDATDQPILAGLIMNYTQLAPNVGGTHDSTVLVNGSATNATTDTPAPPAGRPASLVVTGGPDWTLIGLSAIWLTGLRWIWSNRRYKGGHAERSRTG